MNNRFSYKKLRKYPHLLAEDMHLWDKFIEQYPGRFDFCDYDVHVGNGVEMDQDFGDNYARMAKLLSQFRIDVVAWKGDIPTVIELKPRAAANAIGQVILYRQLFKKEDPSITIVKSMIVTDWQNADVEEVANLNDIAFVTV